MSRAAVLRGRRGIVTGVALVALALPAQSLATRYAAPSGSSADDCHSVATACDLKTAIQGNGPNLPSAGEEVIVEPGNYSFSDFVMQGAPNLNIHGVLTQPRPVVNQSDPLAQLQISSGSISYLDFEAGTTNLVNLSGGLMERVVMHSASNGNFGCQCYGGLIRDSVFVSSGPTAALGVTSNGGTSALTLRDVTAIATNPAAAAITVSHQAPGSVTFDAYNAIARNTAGGSDVSAFGPSATITFHHSNYATSTQTSGGVIQDAPGDPHQGTAPQFANGAGGDFSESAGSPTIDAGLSDPLNGPLDFAGNPRAFGGGTDIGAYEFMPPTTFSLGATRVKIKHSGNGQLPLSCTTPAPDRCVAAGVVTASSSKKNARSSKTVTIGQVAGTVVSGATGALTVQLSKKGRKALFARGKMAATLSGIVANSIGTTAPLSAPLVLKPKARRN